MSLSNHLIKELMTLPILRGKELVPVFVEDRRVEAALYLVHVQAPTEEQSLP